MSEPRSTPSRPSSGARIRVALIEDNRLIREGIISLLRQFPEIEVMEGAHGPDGSLPEGADPHVILLDPGLEDLDCLRLVRQSREAHPGVGIIVMDLLPSAEDLMEFISAGASGFILKDASLEEVLDAIRVVASGRNVLPARLTPTLFSEIAREAVNGNRGEDPGDSVRMTPREREVISLISEGLSNKAMAKALGISIHTVKSHLRNIMEKLTLHSRLEIAAFSFRQDTQGAGSLNRHPAPSPFCPIPPGDGGGADSIRSPSNTPQGAS